MPLRPTGVLLSSVGRNFYTCCYKYIWFKLNFTDIQHKVLNYTDVLRFYCGGRGIRGLDDWKLLSGKKY